MTTPRGLTKLKGDRRLPRLRMQSKLKGGTAFDDEKRVLPQFDDIIETSSFGETEDDEVTAILKRMGNNSADAPLAQRILGYMQSEIPNATLPEAITYDHLRTNGRVFRYQQWVNGGRSAKGGIVPDFLVESGGKWIVWNVQGEYWHSEALNQGKDKRQAYTLVGAIVDGLQIAYYVELWENDLYNRNRREMLWRLAYAGRGLRE